MSNPFSFAGEMSRAPYALVSTALYFSQHALVLLVLAAFGKPWTLPWWFVFNPLRALAFGGFALPEWTLLDAPHLNGYFKTEYARFTITPLDSGKTRLALATRHELDLEPALYWLPLAEWTTHVNKRRVLRHFARQAEARAHAP